MQSRLGDFLPANEPHPLQIGGIDPFEVSDAARGGIDPLGLVHTVSSGTFSHPSGEAWAAFELTRRLARMRRRTITRSRVQTEEVLAEGRAHHAELVTTTYAPGNIWSPRHITEMVACYRKQADRDGHPFRYEWVAELQLKRMRRFRSRSEEVMHYHMIVWALDGYAYPYPDQRGWWTRGMTNVEVARNPVGYLAKYASKGTEGEPLPRGSRISGGGGLSKFGRDVVMWWMRPRYVREAFPEVLHQVRRATGGGWVNHDTGEFLAAPSWDWRRSL